ncbi:MAG: GNAT family N-acetyltransferase [Phycisphaerae bacterium]|jgi:ribosomal protein S18 acetylase RimI-like enzyme
MNVTIRLLGPHDVDFAVKQTAREGWDTPASVFHFCLALDREGNFIAECEGRPAGLVTTTRHRETGWVGNLIVEPDCRRQGVGEQLMRRAMDHLAQQGVRTLRLEAVPLGVSLYQRLGFRDEFESLRFRLEGWREPPTAENAPAERLLGPSLRTVAEFDAEHFGDDRGRLLSRLLQDGHGAWWVPDGGSVASYVITSASQHGVRLGPGVATTPAAAEALIDTVVSEFADAPILAGVPAVNREAIELLTARGFASKPSCRRMVYGEGACGGTPEHVLAIANGAMG